MRRSSRPTRHGRCSYACCWSTTEPTEDDDKRPDTEIGPDPFQSDGVARMLRLLDRLGEVLVADEVGLGKRPWPERSSPTHRAGTGTGADRVPGGLEGRHVGQVLKAVRLLPPRRRPVLDDLRIRSDPDRPGSRRSSCGELDDCALVVVDEARDLRNPHAQRSEAVSALLGGGHSKEGRPADRDSGEQVAGRPADAGSPSSCATTPVASMASPASATTSRPLRRWTQVALAGAPLQPDRSGRGARTRQFVKAQYPGDTIDCRSRSRQSLSLPDARRWSASTTTSTTPEAALLEAVVYA